MKEEFITRFPLPILKWNQMARKMALSAQQTLIVELILCNLSDKEIASQMGIKVPTVRTYLQRAYVRMGVDGRMGLVLTILKASNIAVVAAAPSDIINHDSITDDAATNGLSNYKIDTGSGPAVMITRSLSPPFNSSAGISITHRSWGAQRRH